MNILDNIDRPLIVVIRLTPHQLCFLEPLFCLLTQGSIIVMFELTLLVITCLQSCQVGFIYCCGSKTKKNKTFVSFRQLLDSIQSDLALFNNETANNWKRNWNEIIDEFLLSSSPAPLPHYSNESSVHTTNDEVVKVTGGINFIKSSINADITYNQSQGSQDKEIKLTEKRSQEDKEEEDGVASSMKKKQKTTNSETGSGCFKGYPLQLWELWESFLFSASTDDLIFLYSPERYGVITCGDGISIRNNMPRDAYGKLNKIRTNSYKNCTQYFEDYLSTALDATTCYNMDEALRQLPVYTNESKPVLFFLQDIMQIFSRDVYKKNVVLGHSEAYYNDILVHPTLRVMVLALNKTEIEFIPGEEPLEAMSTQLRRLYGKFDERNCYKGDGVIRSETEENQKVEILLLETSSGYGTASNTKKSFDHHKATFGLLAMMKTLADQFEMGTFDTFSKIKLYFLHVYDTKMRLWSVCSSKQDIYVMNRVWSVPVPALFNKRDEELLNYINCFWDLKEKIETTMNSIMKLKEEHKRQIRQYRFKEHPCPQSLLSYLVNPRIIKLTENDNSKGMHDQLPESSLKPISDDF